MSKVLLVLKNELMAVVLRRSFLLTLFLLPLVSYLTILIVSALQPDRESNILGDILLSPAEPAVEAEGLVDPGGLVQSLPPWLPSDHFQRFAVEEQAKVALSRGEISVYYRISPDYLTTGEVTAVSLKLNEIQSSGSDALRDAINYNLLGKNEHLTRLVVNPVEVQPTYLSNEPARDPTDLLTLMVPYAVTLLFYLVIFGSASMMLNSIAWEKQNRVMEILVTSLTPVQLMTGKMVALGLAGLLQAAVWSSAGFGLLRLSGQIFTLPAGFELPVSILAWGILFFLLGYALYAAMMAGIGALVPGLREASQMSTLVIIPLMLPLFMMGLIINNSNGVAAVILSLIPFTAPVTIMMRLAVGPMPFWQLALSAVILVISTVFMVRFVSGLFRASNLLSGQPFTLRGFLRTLREQG